MNSNEIIIDGLNYSLNYEAKTASIVGFCEPNSEIIIPSTIESNKYVITSISDNALKTSPIKSIQFAPNSEIRTIGNNSFTYSFLQRITLPSNIVNIKEGWCSDSHRLKKVMKNGQENIKIIDKNYSGKIKSKKR